jgi:hypothetical protein
VSNRLRDIERISLASAMRDNHPGQRYASHDYREMATDYGITMSMSRKGNCWETASRHSTAPLRRHGGRKGALHDGLHWVDLSPPPPNGRLPICPCLMSRQTSPKRKL